MLQPRWFASRDARVIVITKRALSHNHVSNQNSRWAPELHSKRPQRPSQCPQSRCIGNISRNSSLRHDQRCTNYTSSSMLALSASRSRGSFNLKHFKYFSSTTDVASEKDEHTNSNKESAPRLSVAIVGAGPSGFYAAKYLTSSVLKRIQSAVVAATAATVDDDEKKSPPPLCWSGIDVDIVERLPTPYGLVRYGVAPDHPEVKNVENDFASLFQNEVTGGDNTIISKNIPDDDCCSPSTLSYFGNVDVGKDISLSHLQSLYHVVILAYGCQAADRQLGIPGEDTLDGVLSAREFVAWYNGHPEFGHIGSIVKRCLWPSSSQDDGEEGESSSDKEVVSPARVVVIGQGNVALDVARILAKGKPGLIDTDTPNSVLEVLGGGVSHVSVVGRRGHVQGAFTIKEMRELTKLKKEGHDATLNVRKEELDLGMTESSVAELKGPSGRPKTRIDKLLQESAASEDSESDTSKQVDLRFLMSPIRLEPNDSNSEHVGRVVCERTKLEGEPFRQKALGTNETETMPADLVLVSIGYRGMPLEGMDELHLFDHQKGTVANDHGKVAGGNNLFVAGWIKRGPTGIVGTNIMDAKDTVHSVMKFIDSGSVQPLDTQQDDSKLLKGRVGLAEFLQSQEGVEAIGWPQFLKIEAAETDRSRLRNDAQPREKILSVDEMLSAAGRLN